MDFKVTTELIGEYLKRFGFPKFELEEEQDEQVGLVRTGWTGDAGVFLAFIDPQEQPGLVRMVVPTVHVVPADAEPERVGELCRYLLHLNSTMLIGAASLHAPSNRIAFSIPLVLRETELSYEVFEFAFRGMLHITEDIAKNARKILAGEADFDEGSGELQRMAPPEISPELMKEFQAWLARQNRGEHDA
ncbi:MAG: YbjN domain-containing protein [Fimbriimonadaceae bacterium]|nr:YbjN domain-containing protein [Fimbriimonadaceae bacterium]